MPLIKRKKAPGIPYNIIAKSQHAPQRNCWQVSLPFCFNYSHVLPVTHCYIQRSTKYECWSVVQKLWKISVMQLEAIHARPWMTSFSLILAPFTYYSTQCILYRLTSVLLCVPFIFADSKKCYLLVAHDGFLCIKEIVRIFNSGYLDYESTFQLGLDLYCCVTN